MIRRLLSLVFACLSIAAQAQTTEVGGVKYEATQQLGKLFTRGTQDNAPREEFSKSIPGTLRMSDLFSAKKKLATGESFSVDWVPGVGTTIVINGKPQREPIKEPEFFSALMKIWLGNSPADSQLKSALLGKAAVTRDMNN